MATAEGSDAVKEHPGSPPPPPPSLPDPSLPIKAVDEAAIRRRVDLRAANFAAAQQQGATRSAKALDSNLKKNTAFIKKIRSGLGSDAKDVLLKEVASLSLERYVSEIAGATLEGSTRCKTTSDFIAAVDVISGLHQRFPSTFTPLYGALLYRALQPPNTSQYESLSSEAVEREEVARISRQRTLLRLAGELYLVGLLGTVEEAQDENVFAAASSADVEERLSTNRRSLVRPKGVKATSGDESFVYGVLRDLLITDTKNHDNLPILLHFVKGLRTFYLSEYARKGLSTSDGKVPYQQLMPLETQVKFCRLCSQYFETVCKHLSKDHAEVQKQQQRNHDAYIKSGVIFEDRQTKYDSLLKSHEKLQTNTQTLADLLDLEMPILKDETAVTAGKSIISSGALGSSLSGPDSESQGDNLIFEDDETRRFYEDLPDLKTTVPLVFLENQQKKKTGDQINVPLEKTVQTQQVSVNGNAQNEAIENIVEGAEKPQDPLSTTDGMDMSAGPAAKLDALFARMPESTSRARIDQDAIDFAFLNSRAARKRLLKHLTTIPKNRLDLIPYYARLIGIVAPYMPDIPAGVVASLEEEFRYGQRKKAPELNSLRAKTIRYLAELVKFRLAPEHVTFHVLKVCLDELTGPNVENICNFLECCGRFLLRNPETSARMAAALEILMRKKQVQNLDSRQVMMIENAYYQVNPPARPAIVEKKRSAIELYIRKLIYNDLSKRNLDTVSRQLRKLPWQDEQVCEILYKVFGKIWKVKYSNIPQMAIVVAELYRYHTQFGVIIVDQILEDIQIELEHNLFRHNQRRIATIKYFGELFNYRMVDAQQVFAILWHLVTFGHEQNRPSLERPTSMDSPDDFFRIRLICTLLDTCGIYFDKGSLKKKLEQYVVFFQMYILSKSAMSLDIRFMVEDTLEALPLKAPTFASYAAAAAAVDAAIPQNLPAEAAITRHDSDREDSDEGDEDDRPSSRQIAGEGEEEEGEQEDERAEDHAEMLNGEVVSSGSDDSDEGSTSSESNSSSEGASDESEDDDDDSVRGIQHEEEDEFARELGRMMTISENERKPASFALKSGLAEVNVPRRRTTLQSNKQSGIGGSGGSIRDLPDEQADDVANNKDAGPATAHGMSFTLLSRRGNKHSTADLWVPTESKLARAAQEAREREKNEQRELKRLVLNYEERGQEYESSSIPIANTPRQNPRPAQSLPPFPGLKSRSDGRRWGTPGTLDQALREAG